MSCAGQLPATANSPGIEIQLLATGDYQVLATGKTNAAGEYAFKAPDRGYHIVATGDKAHVTNMASVDIW